MSQYDCTQWTFPSTRLQQVSEVMFLCSSMLLSALCDIYLWTCWTNKILLTNFTKTLTLWVKLIKLTSVTAACSVSTGGSENTSERIFLTWFSADRSPSVTTFTKDTEDFFQWVIQTTFLPGFGYKFKLILLQFHLELSHITHHLLGK